MNQLKHIADSITEMFKLEADIPSYHADGHVPMLDLKVWVETKSINTRGMEGQDVEEDLPRVEMTPQLPDGWNVREIPQVRFEFYSKPMASQLVMAEASAAPLAQKRTVLTQEGIRR